LTFKQAEARPCVAAKLATITSPEDDHAAAELLAGAALRS
jgi:hypothetical protein